jgi:hypothetical protein
MRSRPPGSHGKATPEAIRSSQKKLRPRILHAAVAVGSATAAAAACLRRPLQALGHLSSRAARSRDLEGKYFWRIERLHDLAAHHAEIGCAHAARGSSLEGSRQRRREMSRPGIRRGWPSVGSHAVILVDCIKDPSQTLKQRLKVSWHLASHVCLGD